MPRFFMDFPPEEGAEIWITGENGLHIARSLRMRPGEALTLCNAMGTDCPAVVLQTDKAGALVRLGRRVPNLAEPRTGITVYQCLPKGDKLETVVQKAVELGASAVVPVMSRRCVVKADDKTAEKKTARLQKIALEAAKQSGRGKIPTVENPVSLQTALGRAARAGTVLFCYEAGGAPLSKCLPKAGDAIGIFIGPEGGFAPEEAALAESLGAEIVTLGPRILRTETAALSVLSMILYAKGEME